MRCGQRCVRAAQFGALLLVAACSAPSPPPPASESGASGTESPSRDAAAARNPPGPDELPPVASPYDVLPEAARAELDRLFVGDLDQMVSRRLIRAGVVFNRTQYFIDGGTQRGFAYESLRLFEEQLNKRLKTGALPVHVAFVPLARDQLFPALIDGKVDLAAAALTITPEREKLVRFSDPTRVDVSEIVVTPKGAPPLTAATDLSNRQVYVRRSSSYYDSLVHLNADLVAAGKAPVILKEAPEALEDDDLLEMVNAGLVETIVVDDFVATFWQQVFTNLQLHPQAAVRTGGTIAVAARPNNPVAAGCHQRLDQGVRSPHDVRQRHGQALSAGRPLRQGRHQRSRAEKVRTPGQPVPEVRRAIRHRLPIDGGAGLPGIGPRSWCSQSRRRHRRHAGHARHRQGPQGRAISGSSNPMSTPASSTCAS